jgi:UDP-4-amino-4,6-dideoxy-N-acetyl-beta-L-altrosamine N-acetyltransferase
MTLPQNEFRLLEHTQLKQVWQWRNSPRIQSNMHNNEPVTWEDHCRWFDKLQGDSSRKFFIFWQNAKPIGVLNFSALGSTLPEWGCYLGETHVWPGSGIVLEAAALDFAASDNNFSHLLAQVLSFNTAANKLHKVFEYEYVKSEYGGERDGQAYDVLHYRYDLVTWPNMRKTILTKLPKKLALVADEIKFIY